MISFELRSERKSFFITPPGPELLRTTDLKIHIIDTDYDGFSLAGSACKKIFVN